MISLLLNTVPELHPKSNLTLRALNSNESILLVSNVSTIFPDHPVLEIIDAVCMSWFTIEYIIRLWSCPYKKKFFKGFLNFVDLMTIIPYFIATLFTIQNFFSSFVVLNNARRVLQVIRILRILKISRYSICLKTLGYTVKHSFKELGMLIVFLATGVLLFSSLAYFAEREQPSTKFSSIPSSFW